MAEFPLDGSRPAHRLVLGAKLLLVLQRPSNGTWWTDARVTVRAPELAVVHRGPTGLHARLWGVRFNGHGPLA